MEDNRPGESVIKKIIVVLQKQLMQQSEYGTRYIRNYFQQKKNNSQNFKLILKSAILIMQLQCIFSILENKIIECSNEEKFNICKTE